MILILLEVNKAHFIHFKYIINRLSGVFLLKSTEIWLSIRFSKPGYKKIWLRSTTPDNTLLVSVGLGLQILFFKLFVKNIPKFSDQQGLMRLLLFVLHILHLCYYLSCYRLLPWNKWNFAFSSYLFLFLFLFDIFIFIHIFTHFIGNSRRSSTSTSI